MKKKQSKQKKQRQKKGLGFFKPKPKEFKISGRGNPKLQLEKFGPWPRQWEWEEWYRESGWRSTERYSEEIRKEMKSEAKLFDHQQTVINLAGHTKTEALEERVANGDGIRDDDQHPTEYERRTTKQSKRPAKPKVKVGIREYRKGHWQLTFSHGGKQVHLQKWIDGTPLTAKPMAMALKGVIEKDGYDAAQFGRDTTFNFDVCARNWVKLSQVSPEWQRERSRIVEKIFIPHFGKTDIRKITTIRVDEFQVALQNRKLSPKYISGIMGELKAFFRFNRKALPDLPDFRKIQLQDKPIRWLTWEEQDTVFQYIPKEHLPISDRPLDWQINPY